MSAEHLEIIVEEPSMEAFLRELLPRIVGERASYGLFVHQGKDDLLGKLGGRLIGYSSWLPETWRVVVLVDRDDDDCLQLKWRLEQAASMAQLETRSTASTPDWRVVNRIAVEELEAWYFGDWDAVRDAYPSVPPTIPSKSQFRDPDAISGGTWEALERVLQRAGYFKSGIRKMELARTLGGRMDPTRNQSHSFQVFHAAVLDAIS